MVCSHPLGWVWLLLEYLHTRSWSPVAVCNQINMPFLAFFYHAWLWDFPDIWKSCEFVLPGTYSTSFGRVLPGWTLCFFQTEVSNSSTLILAVVIRAVCFRFMHFSPIERTLQVAISVAYYSLQVPKVLLLMSNLPFTESCSSTLWKNSYFGYLLTRQTHPSFPAN
jgi:hypothetical protein